MKYFGHGYRIRDLGTKYAKVVGYKMYVFAGMTTLTPTDKLTVSQMLAINIAGLEADAILAHKPRSIGSPKDALNLASVSLHSIFNEFFNRLCYDRA